MQMQNNATFFESAVGPLIANGLGIVAVLLVAAVLTNTSVPFISGDRAAFVALAVIGMSMCALGGIGKAQAGLGWAHPLTIVGIVLGSLALLLVAAVLTGRAGFLEPVATATGGRAAAEAVTDRAALLVLAGIIALKWALGSFTSGSPLFLPPLSWPAQTRARLVSKLPR
jgi:hypothetical protein